MSPLLTWHKKHRVYNLNTMETMAQDNIQVEEKVKQVVKEPSKYAVVYINDEQTPMDFVINSLTIKSPLLTGDLSSLICISKPFL